MNLVVSVLVKPTIILFFALLLSLVWRRASSSTRCAIWTAALLSALILPIAELVLPKVDLPVMSVTQTAMTMKPTPIPWPESIRENTLLSVTESRSAVDVGLEETGPSASSLPLKRVTAFLALAWVVGFSAVLVRLMFGVRAAQRLTKQSTIPDEESKQLLVELRLQMSVTQAVRVAIVSSAQSPVTWGLRTSVIVLPGQFARWSSELRRAVLIHELAHVKRRDLLLQIVAQGACAVYWFNPLFWYVASRMRVEREQACDDYVLNFGASPSGYAASLIQIARAGIADRWTGAALAMAQRSQLETRIRAVMTANRNRRTLSRMSEASLLCCIGILTAAVAAVQLTALPVMPPPRLFVEMLPIETAGRPGAEVMVNAVETSFSRNPTAAYSKRAPLSQRPTASGILSPASAKSNQVQSPVTAAPSTFEVASIKENQIPNVGLRGGCHGIDTIFTSDDIRSSVPLGRCVITGAPIGQLVNIAYRVGTMQMIKRQPDLAVGNTRFDVEAKAENAATVTEGELRAMLQNVLLERFKLKFHREAADSSGFALTAASGGLLMQHAGTGELEKLTRGLITRDQRAGDMTANAFSMQRLATYLAVNVAGLGSVVDRTGIAGTFNFKLAWNEEAGPSIFTAIQEQLGLRLETQTITIEYFVIDSAEKPKLN